jgi:hypothetical protein
MLTLVIKHRWAPVASRPCGANATGTSSDSCTVSAANIAAGLPALSFGVQQNGPRLQLPLAALLLPGACVCLVSVTFTVTFGESGYLCY